MSKAQLILLFLLLPIFGIAYAEVMDKEPSLMQNMLLGLVSSVLCLFTARFKPWLLLLVIPVPAFYFWGLIREIRNPFVGPAMLNEAGEIYIYSGYGLSVLLFASVLVGLFWRIVKRQHNKRLQPIAREDARSG